MSEEGKPSGDKIIAAPLEEVRRARGESVVAVPLELVRSVRGESVVALPRSKVASLRAFRRIRADRVLGIIGIVFVLIGVLMIFTWEKPPEVVKKYSVEWPLSTELLTNETASFTCADATCSGAEETYTVNVNQTNVTAVVFWLYWEDDVAGEGQDQSEGDTFQIEYSGPEGTNITNIVETRLGGRAGMNISRTYVIAMPPDLGAVQPADNDAEAMALIGDRTTRNGTGDWTFTIRLLKAVDDWTPGPAGDEARAQAEQRGAKCAADGPLCNRDEGNDYTFGFQIIRYAVAIERQF